MPTERLELLLEAERRGLLPPEEHGLLTEARQRGLIAPARTRSTDELTAHVQGRSTPLPGFAQPAETTGQRLVRGAAPAMIGGALGMAAGTLIAPGPGTVIGTMLGSAAGEAVTQFRDPLNVGIDQPSLFQVAAAGVLPMIPATARRFFTSLPGAAAGAQDFLLRKLGVRGQRVIEETLGTQSSKALFQAAQASGQAIQVPLVRTAQTAADIAAEVAASKFVTGGARTLAKRAQDFAGQGTTSFEQFRLNQSDVGALVRSLDKQGGAALGRAKQLYGAMWDDLNNALSQAQGPTAATLREAIATYKREEAAKFLKDIFTKSQPRRVGQLNLDIDQAMTRIDRARDVLSKQVGSETVDDILGVLRRYAQIPVVAKTPRLGFEQMPFAERAVAGGAVGFVITGEPVGAATGILLVEALSMAFTSPPGRLFIREMMEHGATLDQIANGLLQAGRAGALPPVRQSEAIQPREVVDVTSP